MASIVAGTGVKLKGSTDTLSGSTTLTGIDSNGRRTNLATITASGSPTKGGSAFSAGNNNGWSLSVTYDTNGTATGSAAGNWSGISEVDVPVQVDAPGRSHHRRKAGTKKKTKAKASSKRPAKKKKASKSRTSARRTKAPARKARGGRR